MQRRVKLNFKPLSLDETAQRLGVPRARARKILAMIGVDLDAPSPLRRTRKARTAKPSSHRTKTRAR